MVSSPRALGCDFELEVRQTLSGTLPSLLGFSRLIYKIGFVTAENICEVLSL